MLTAEQILKINHPGKIFTDNITDNKFIFRSFIKEWHPDKNSNPVANDVFLHVVNLHKQAEEMINNGKWIDHEKFNIIDEHNNKQTFNYQSTHKFELGEIFVNDNQVIFIIDEKYKNLFNNCIKTISSFKFASSNMEKEFSKYLPKQYNIINTNDKRIVLIINKTQDVFLLKDIYNYFDGHIPDVHVRWIISTLHNIVCYLAYNGISHNAISLDTYFISPKYHSGLLLGGWWYAMKRGKKLISVPERTYNLMPPDLLTSKKASTRIDGELIRALGREILGDPSGSQLSKFTVPEIVNWLKCAGSSNQIKDYDNWSKVLDSLGTRKFVNMEIDIDKLYNK